MPKAHGKSVTPEQVLENIREIHAKLGHTPSFSEYRLHGGKYHRTTFRTRFGEYGAALKALGLTPRTGGFLPHQDFPIEIYEEFPRINADKIDIWCDLHIPYHDVDLCNEAIASAKARGVETLVILGDFLDFKGLYRKEIQNVRIDWVTELKAAAELMDNLSKTFKKVWVIMGNHDWRLSRFLGNNEQAQGLFSLIFKQENVIFSKYFFCLINDFLYGVHPDTMRKGKLSLVEELADHHNKSVIMGHSHRFSFGIHDGGKHLLCEGLCMTLRNAHEYTGLKLTTYSSWIHGWWEVVGQSVRPHVKHKHILNGEKNDETQARLCNGKNRKNKNGVRNASCNC